jgi:hypothetical protein
VVVGAFKNKGRHYDEALKTALTGVKKTGKPGLGSVGQFIG